MTDFVRNVRTPQGATMFTCSVARYFLPAHKLVGREFAGPDRLVDAWWGPSVPARAGDILVGFQTPIGFAVEAVLPPPPKD